MWPPVQPRSPGSAACWSPSSTSFPIAAARTPCAKTSTRAPFFQRSRSLSCISAAQWRDARVIEENGAWRADPAPAAGDDKFPIRAYLIPDPTGRALLAVLHGGWDGGSAFDATWKQLAASARFLSSSDSSELEDAG